MSEQQALQVTEPTDLAKPQEDTKFAHAAAKVLMDIVKRNGWNRNLGGTKDHLDYEAWQTVGKYYSYTVKTGEAEYVEQGDIWGFRAKATVINEQTGVEVGGAEAYCMSDEAKWKSKPRFQLASMAQTRAGSKALRQILGFVVALAGYSPTPSEEMTGTEYERNQKPVKEAGWLEGDSYTREPLDQAVSTGEIVTCTSCDEVINDPAVISYSQRFYGKVLCRNCQRTATRI